jgi:putative transposase
MRKARVKIVGAGAVYHCIGRVVGGEMLLGDAEREMMRRLIRQHARFAGIEVITQCIMSNHFHVLVRVPEATNPSDEELVQRVGDFYQKNSPYVTTVLEAYEDEGFLPEYIREGLLGRMGDLSVFMKEVKQRYAKWHNKRHTRFGTIWAERFKSIVVEDRSSVLATVAAYIDLNPVRAGLVLDPKEYRWCGYAEATVGVVGAREGYQRLFDLRDWCTISREYRRYLFVRAGVSGHSSKRELGRDAIRKVLDEGGELALAEVLRLRVRYFNDGVAIGSKEFVDGVFKEFRNRFGVKKRKTGARKIPPLGGLRDLCTLRNLKTKPYS